LTVYFKFGIWARLCRSKCTFLKLKKMRALTILFLSIATTSIAQENFNILENRSLTRQKVYESESTPDAILRQIKQAGTHDAEQVSEDEIHVYIKDMVPDWEGLGYTRMNCISYVLLNNINAFAIIEFKDNRYRVTVKNIRLVQTTVVANLNLCPYPGCPLEDYAVNKKGFTKSFIKYGKIYDLTFSNFLELKKENTEKW